MVRFGIAGFGLHAVKRLIPGFSLAKNCRVTALSRRNLADAKQSAAKYNIPLAFGSVAELCRAPEVDAIFVTTPNSCHLADVLTAIEAGKPVLCEKPLAVNAAQCREMVEAARKRGVVFGVAQIFRFAESVRRIRDLVAAGKIGRPIFARSEFSFFGDVNHPRKWLHDANIAGAGPIFDIGVHCIDTLRFILGDEVSRVHTSAISDELSGTVEAAAALTLEFTRGTIGTALVSFRAEYRTPVELVGSTAVLRADDALNVERPIEIQIQRSGSVIETYTAANHGAYALQVDAFADAVEGKAAFPVTGEEGWQNQEILDSALRSIGTGKAEAVPRILIQ